MLFTEICVDVELLFRKKAKRGDHLEFFHPPRKCLKKGFITQHMQHTTESHSSDKINSRFFPIPRNNNITAMTYYCT